MVLLISDDGVGIAPEKLPTILSGDGNQYFRRNKYCNLQYAPTSSDSVSRPDYGLTYSSKRRCSRHRSTRISTYPGKKGTDRIKSRGSPFLNMNMCT